MKLKKPLYIIPVSSPAELKEKINNFYENNKNKIVEDYSREISIEQNLRITLRWDEKGLTNISTPSGGFDLDNLGRRFKFHNIDENSSLGKFLIDIAEKYVSELLNE